MTREREVKQFKFLILAGLCIYPFWLAYGLWSESYNAPISTGVMCIWAYWFINYTKNSAQNGNEKKDSKIDWYTFSIEKHINYPVLVLSLLVAMFFGAGTLFLVTLLFGKL